MELQVVRHLARSALQNLEAHRRRIDDLNVYPVPDGDTGTNLVLTLRSIVEALDASTAGLAPPPLALHVARRARVPRLAPAHPPPGTARRWRRT